MNWDEIEKFLGGLFGGHSRQCSMRVLAAQLAQGKRLLKMLKRAR
jgi:hypothetical protein